VDNLDLYCGFHHVLKTKGWQRTGGPGCYRLVPPGTKADATSDSDRECEAERAPP
jgi:hypothetical protein